VTEIRRGIKKEEEIRKRGGGEAVRNAIIHANS